VYHHQPQAIEHCRHPQAFAPDHPPPAANPFYPTAATVPARPQVALSEQTKDKPQVFAPEEGTDA
jgi:hypothetical protein